MIKYDKIRPTQKTDKILNIPPELVGFMKYPFLRKIGYDYKFCFEECRVPIFFYYFTIL
jgi:hypothetical protein